MASRPRSSSKASKIVDKIKDKLSPTKASSKRKREDGEPSSLSDLGDQQRSTSPEPPFKRLRVNADASSESSQPSGKFKGEKQAKGTKKSKRELKVEVSPFSCQPSLLSPPFGPSLLCLLIPLYVNMILILGGTEAIGGLLQ